VLWALGLHGQRDVETRSGFRARATAQLAEVCPLDSGQRDRVAQYALAASEPHAPFGTEGSGHLDDIRPCPVLTPITQGDRARAGGEDKGGDEHDR
jgi:hypothetical protein